MKKKAFALLVTIFLPVWVFSIDYPGTVVDEQEKGVPLSTIVLLELDLLVTTEDDGTFMFTDVTPGRYTLLVIAPGFLEWEGSFDFEKDELHIVLSPEVVEMDQIVVTATDVLPEAVLDNEVSKEELERLPPRSDPFDAVSQESGILKDMGNIFIGQGGGGSQVQDGEPGQFSINIEGGTLGRISMTRRDDISVYGGESDWNNYYYDYFRLPTNKHTFGYPEPGPIVPVEAVDEIGIYKGVIPVEHGPAIGGLFTLEPVTGAEGFSITFTPSIMDISLLSRWNIIENLDLLISANQSIVQYTVFPILQALITIESEEQVTEEGDPTSFRYGDALLRLQYSPPNHLLSFDAIAYYDFWLFDISFEDFVLYSEYGPYFVAAGTNWKYSPAANITNSLYGFGAYYSDFGNYSFHFPTSFDFTDENSEPDAFYDLSFDWLSRITSFQIGDEFFWEITPSASLLFGLNIRLADLQGDYTEVVIQKDTAGAEISNETLKLAGVSELFPSVYGYAKFLGRADLIKYNGGIGLLWYPSSTTFRPSINGEILYLGDKIVLALGAGWSPGIIDEFSYIDRRLDEQYYELESITELDYPPMAFSAAAQAVYTISEKHRLSASPYFAWYYDLSGIAISTSGSDMDGAFISYDPSKGYSFGVDVGWKAQLSEMWDLSVSYAFSWTRYLTEEWGWVSPNTEVSHALKSGLLFKYKGLKIGQNLLIYSGVPFTPDVVVENDIGELVVEPGDYNSAFEYVPQFDVKTNFIYTWDFKRFDMSLFLNSSNWLAMFNAVLLGLEPGQEETLGATSANYADREYYFAIEWTDILVNAILSEIGMSFAF